MSICHEIPVLALLCISFLHPCPFRIVEKIVLRLVDQCPAVLCQNAILELTDFSLLHVRHPRLCLDVSVQAVKCAEGSLEVLLLFHARLPCEESVCRHDLKIVLGELSCTFLICENHLGCGDLNLLACTADLVGHFRIVSL